MEVQLSAIVAFILLLSSGSSNGQITSFRDDPASSNVLLNFPTSLSCSTNLPYPHSIVWQFNGVAETGDSSTYDASNGRSLLSFSRIAYSDAGNYTCVALDSNSNVITSSQPAILSVLGPPIFQPTLSGMSVQENGEVTFICSVVSNPPATVTWFSEVGSSRQLVSPGPRINISRNSLTISNAQQSDAGFYTCDATNTFGSNTTTARLVLAALTPLEVTITPDDSNPLEISEGGGVTLRCTATTNVSISSLSWSTMSGREITGVAVTSNVQLLSISPASPTDSDIYVCSAVDFQDRNASNSLEIIVTRAPTFSTEPEDVMGRLGLTFTAKLECVATGIPSPTVTWLDPNMAVIPVNSATQTPLIANGRILTRADTGVYTCVATNGAGEIRSQFMLTVQAPPVFEGSLQSVTTPPDRDVVLGCMAQGSPEPTYSWSKLNGMIPQDAISSATSGDLRLFGVTSNSAGSYVCTASNSFGMATSMVTLEVLARPAILEASDSPLVTPAGATFSLNCVGSGPAETILQWYLNGALLNTVQDGNLDLGPTGRLTVSMATTSYSGVYTCNVSTSFASVTAQINVIVGVQPSILIPPSDLDLPPGSTAFLNCTASGSPTPQSSWTRTSLITGLTENLDTIGPSYFQLSTGLQLNNVGRNDSAMYECRLQNALGQISIRAVVRVEAAPIVSSLSPTTLVVGANTTLTCSTSFNYPAGNVSWSRSDTGGGGDPLPIDRFTVNEDGSLLVAPVTMEDGGPLTCAVDNQYGRSSTTAQITVQFPPSVNITSGATAQGLLGQSLMLSCDVRGEPRPTVDWVFPSGDSTASGTGKSQFFRETGTLIVADFQAQDTGTYTCMATNRFGVVTATTEASIAGPPVELSVVPGSITAQRFDVMWLDLPFFAQNSLDRYEVSTATHSRSVNTIVSQETFRFFERTATLSELFAGTVYNVSIRALFFGDLVGLNSSILVTTLEGAPSGPPLNVSISIIDEGAILSWMLPAESMRNGNITGYLVEYRLTSASSFTTMQHSLDSQTETSSSLTLSGLTAGVTYEVRIAAMTAVGRGPYTEAAQFVPAHRFQPLSGQALGIGIGVGVVLLGVAFITAVVLLVGLLSCYLYKKRTKEGKHKPLVDPESGSSNKRRKKKTDISGPVPGITPQVDSSVQGKFRIQGQDGNAIQLKPKVITEKDVAPKPKKGDSVRKVAKEETVLAPSNDDTDGGRIDVYHMPVDSLKSSRPISQPLPGSERILMRPESGIYSEVSDQPQTPPPNVSIETNTLPPPYEEVNYGSEAGSIGDETWGRTAAEESDEGSQVFLTSKHTEEDKEEEETFEERDELETPEPPEAPDIGRDDSNLLYSTVPKEHIEKKREQKQREEQRNQMEQRQQIEQRKQIEEKISEKQAKENKKAEEKREKERRKMEEKMERENRKREEKERKKREKEEAKEKKQREEEKKKRARDQQQRESMGLSNIVYQETDFTKGRSAAQAHFIDTASAALF